ncbi:FAD-binding oxidoreductase [Acidianus manzaensis]|uniref:FAD-binding PCMH-type domain-containing protein n=1 Tax=Acidianus manzaensis TaxID=282676 RepID=A0A1W6JYY4_9CREN|nr:FAD-binding oxidoreductase [Acidianus manzaensis]ARM75404.1 hypothetical protein B6F84_04745 [Acidianus manzaensis]
MNTRYFDQEKIDYSIDKKIVIEKSKDWSFTSPILSKISKEKIADIVVFPKDEDEVIKIVEYAIEEHIPIIPRGSGYGTVGGLIPIKGGIILDMSKLSSVVEEDEEEITVYAGTPFYDKGFLFNPRVYPTIYQKASIGGYFCGGSWGIGSFMFGPNWDQVTEVTMVNPRGKLVKLKGGDTKIAAHAEGTTGIVTRLKVLKFTENDYIPQLFLFDRLHDAIKFIEKLYEDLPLIYHITLRSPEITHLTKDITGFDTNKWAVLVVSKDIIEGYIDGSPLWSKRNVFFAGVYTNLVLKEKREIYYTQYHIEIDKLEEMIKKVRESQDVIIESEFANDRKGHTYFMVYNEPAFFKVQEILGATTFNLHSLYINNRLDKAHLQRILMYKKMYDKEDLFNPGKIKV